MSDTQLLTKRQQFERIRAQLENERSSFISHWQELGEYLLPRGPRFDRADVNRGNKRNDKIIDSTGTMALRTLSSGMMSGVTSPARPWFRLTTPDPELNENGNVKSYLYTVGERMTTVFLRSNLYNCLPTVYEHMGCFGTSAMMVEEDMDDVVRFYTFPIGSYSIANDHKGKVNTFCRTFRYTVRQMVEKFGQDPDTPGKINWDVFSPRIKDYWDQSNYGYWIDVTHVIKPNEKYDPRKLHSKFKKFVSVYYETGSQSTPGGQSYQDNEVMLREKGYDYFPVLAPRWQLSAEDSYGTRCPGMDALGDIKQLQHGEKRAAQAIDKMINPPLVGDADLKTQRVSVLPGDVTYLTTRQNGVGLKSVYDVNFRLVEHDQRQQAIRGRIKSCLFEDLFLMLSQSDRRSITAREVDERHEEKLLALGPVLEQLNQDLLDPLIDITFTIMNRQRILPQSPQELQNAPLQVEYISIMAQAQKLVGIESIERFAGFVGQIMQVNPQSGAEDMVDTDEMVMTYGDMTSVPPGIIRSMDKVQAMRQQKQQAQQQQQQQQANAQAAQTAQTLANTPTSGQTALNAVMQQTQAGQMAPTR